MFGGWNELPLQPVQNVSPPARKVVHDLPDGVSPFGDPPACLLRIDPLESRKDLYIQPRIPVEKVPKQPGYAFRFRNPSYFFRNGSSTCFQMA